MSERPTSKDRAIKRSSAPVTERPSDGASAGCGSAVGSGVAFRVERVGCGRCGRRVKRQKSYVLRKIIEKNKELRFPNENITVLALQRSLETKLKTRNICTQNLKNCTQVKKQLPLRNPIPRKQIRQRERRDKQRDGTST